MGKMTHITILINFGETRQSIQWTPGYTIHWKPMKTILIVNENSLIRNLAKKILFLENFCFFVKLVF